MNSAPTQDDHAILARIDGTLVSSLTPDERAVFDRAAAAGRAMAVLEGVGAVMDQPVVRVLGGRG